MTSVPEPGSPPVPNESVPSASEPSAVDERARAVDVVDPANVRRAPKFRAFVFAGIAVGFIVGMVVGLIVFPGNDQGWTLAIFTFEAMLGGSIVGAVLAVLLDRRSLRVKR